MKIIFAWPPLKNPKGYATVTQSRQFQWLKDPTFIYPIVAAQCATMLFQASHQVLWLDAIAEEMDEVEFGKVIISIMPDYIIFEACTPVIQRYWEIINGIKEILPEIKIILTGDHPTALPEESKKNCSADFIVGGGRWQKQVFRIVHPQPWQENTTLPLVDRNLTHWWLYAYHNGNFRLIPATYIMAAQDCWHRPGCTFCAWAEYHKDCFTRPANDVLAEIEKLIQMGFKEIFDDSGTFPVGDWLHEFCNGIIKNKFYKYVNFGCNMRFGALDDGDFKLLSKAGFKMILWGMESVNQRTLELLNKGYPLARINKDLILAKAAELQSHITVMFGYPWESYEEAKRTFNMTKYFLLNGWAFSAQASICIPYPITPLWKMCKENGLLLTEEWEEYDMTKAVMKIPYPEKELFKLQRGIYNLAYHPKFIWQKIRQIKDWDDIPYYFRIGRKIYDRFGSFYEVSKVSIDD